MPWVGHKALTMSLAGQRAGISALEHNMGREAINAIGQAVHSLQGVVKGTRQMNVIIVKIQPSPYSVSPTSKVDFKACQLT